MVKVDCTLSDVYNDYSESNPNVIDKKTFCSLVEDFNKLVADKVLNEGKTLKLAGDIGEFRIVKLKTNVQLDGTGQLRTNRLKVDYKTTWESWFKKFGVRDKKWIMENTKKEDRKLIYHFNNHSNGYYFRWQWYRLGVRLFAPKYYTFKPVRSIKNRLTSLIKNAGYAGVTIYQHGH